MAHLPALMESPSPSLKQLFFSLVNVGLSSLRWRYHLSCFLVHTVFSFWCSFYYHPIESINVSTTTYAVSSDDCHLPLLLMWSSNSSCCCCSHLFVNRHIEPRRPPFPCSDHHREWRSRKNRMSKGRRLSLGNGCASPRVLSRRRSWSTTINNLTDVSTNQNDYFCCFKDNRRRRYSKQKLLKTSIATLVKPLQQPRVLHQAGLVIERNDFLQRAGWWGDLNNLD